MSIKHVHSSRNYTTNSEILLGKGAIVGEIKAPEISPVYVSARVCERLGSRCSGFVEAGE